MTSVRSVQNLQKVYKEASSSNHLEASFGLHLRAQQPRPVVERQGHIRVLRTQHLLLYGL